MLGCYYLAAAKTALQADRLREARSYLARCLAACPNDPEARFLAARSARRAGDLEQAGRLLAELNKAKEIPEAIGLEVALLRAQAGEVGIVGADLWPLVQQDTAEARLVLEAFCEGYLKREQWPEVIVCARKLLLREPRSHKAYFWLGIAQDETGRIGEAVDSYMRALSLDPDDDQARINLAVGQLSQNQLPLAIANFEQVRIRQPGNEFVLSGLARCYRIQGESEAARTLLDQLLGKQPKKAALLAERGKIELDVGNASEAEGWFRKSLQVSPDDAETNYNLYTCLCCLGRHEEARRQQDKVNRISADEIRLSQLKFDILSQPRNLDLRCQAAVLLLRTGHPEKGMLMLRNVLQENPRHVEARQALFGYIQAGGVKNRRSS
jgi:tetratricopeptide (TPR) repeat protein